MIGEDDRRVPARPCRNFAIATFGATALVVMTSTGGARAIAPTMAPRADMRTTVSAEIRTAIRPPHRAPAHAGGQTFGGKQAIDDAAVSVADAVRFLNQATFGPTFVTDPADPSYGPSVAHVQELGFEAWLTEQFTMPVLYPDDPSVPWAGTNYESPYDPGACDDGALGGSVCWSPVNIPTTCTNSAASTCQRDNYTAYRLQNEFFTNALTGRDQLRQRVAWALTQIDVVSEVDIGIRPASWMKPYVQLFDRDALGNYRQLLYDLTVNPAMGEYLNMRGNTYRNVNENYAREVLQLFSIGVNRLNDDGSVQVDENGVPAPTYTQDVITAFARVFTGWNLQAQLAAGVPNYRDPMVANENNHDQNPKVLLDGQTVDADAVTELNQALDIIFAHPNVGPFVGKQLIQKLVTSNPSPQYVQRVTSAFNSGSFTGPQGTSFGSGIKGDMQAVIAAILLDPEARNTPDPSDPTYGHLREPVLFITNTLRALNGVYSISGDTTTDFVLGDQFLPSGANANVRMDQDVFRPPTVFSYYPPDNQLPGTALLAPEFGIQSTSTSLARINIVYDFAYRKMPVDTKNRPLGTWIDTTRFEPEACVGDPCDPGPLVDDLGMRLLGGAMTPGLRSIVTNAVQALDPADLTGRVQEAIYLIASSSEYQVER